MKAPDDLAAQAAEKTNDQLAKMLQRPDDWLPEALEVARAELQRRGVDPNTVSFGPPPMPAGQPIFFPVSPLKLVVMSTVTFGIYELYWFYQNWKLVKHRTRSDIMPFWRAFFGFFFCYSMFRKIQTSASERGLTAAFSPGLLTILWIGITSCWRLPNPYWLMSMLAVLALLPVQFTVSQLNASVTTTYDSNSRFTAWNIAGIVIGGLFLVFAIIGTFMPE
jgi:hypothetical protein